MPKNPARTVALINLALFALVVAAVLWLQRSDAPRDSNVPVQAAFGDTTDARADTLSLDAVEEASAAQVDFINELLTDTSRTVQRAFTVRSPHREQAYYLGATIRGGDASRSEMALWLVQGPRDQPRSVQAMNDAAARHSVVRRVASSSEEAEATEAAARVLVQRLDAESS